MTQLNAGKYLTFMLNGQPYGVGIGAVREINRVSEITRVPLSPGFVAGVMNLRGKVIPVLDLRSRLGMPRVEATKETCIIVFDVEQSQVGTIVDSVSGVADFAESQLEPRPRMGSDQLSWVLGMGKQESQVVLLLDISACLASIADGFVPGEGASGGTEGLGSAA
jgi:purine-binding chemotaxis protein CheW